MSYHKKVDEGPESEMIPAKVKVGPLNLAPTWQRHRKQGPSTHTSTASIQAKVNLKHRAEDPAHGPRSFLAQ